MSIQEAAAPSPVVEKTLYQRLGGDAFMEIFVNNFLDETFEDPSLTPFLKNVSVGALKCHQVKLFKVIFGCDAEKPEEDEFLDYMLATHTRLFRDLGLDATHFDTVATCFVQALQSFQIDQDMIDECVAILGPLRAIFEYGAKVAAKEKEMEPEQLKELPIASAKNIGTDLVTVLPDPASIDIPDWLPAALGKPSKPSVVRAWTAELTDRFGVEGDKVIADTFMDMPYMNHHVYLSALLQLAFLPDSVEPAHKENLVCMIRYPRGPDKAPLSRKLFDRMIVQFVQTCESKNMKKAKATEAENRLRSNRHNFPKVKGEVVHGVHAPHKLRKVKEDPVEDVEIGSAEELHDEAGEKSYENDEPTEELSIAASSANESKDEIKEACNENSKKGNKKAIKGFKWGRVLGWIKR